MSRHRNPANVDPDASKLFSTTTQKQYQCRSTALNKVIFVVHWNQVKFDTPHWTQVNLNHPHKIQVNLHADTKNRWFSPRVQNPSKFRPPTQQNQFHPHTQIKPYSIPRTELKSISTTHTRIKSNFMLIQRNKWFSASIQVTSQFLPHTHQNNFIPRLKSIRVRSPTLRSSQFRPPPPQEPSPFPYLL